MDAPTLNIEKGIYMIKIHLLAHTMLQTTDMFVMLHLIKLNLFKIHYRAYKKQKLIVLPCMQGRQGLPSTTATAN